MKCNLKTLSFHELELILAEMGEKTYHARQISRWLYQRGVADFAAMTDISQSLRRKLDEGYYISEIPLVEVRTGEDGCSKYVFRLPEGFDIESVLIPDQGRLTLCISTQLGCRQGCRFCLTSRMGFIRNLLAHEICDQVIQVKKRLPEEKTTLNIVLMGMGEPLDNYQQTISAIRLMTSPLGLNISPRHITLSTAGLVEELYRLRQEKLGINLAVSINAPFEDLRSWLMPVNRRYSLEYLLKALRDFPLPARQRFTIEYILIGGVNDSPEAARQLCRLLRGIPCKINLIPYNPNPFLNFRECTEKSLEQFQQILIQHHLTATVRRSRGRDIGAACGQLGYVRYRMRQAELTHSATKSA
ncbi:MAG: 23S rRNA (adenine(2503)-C(2))-methyltransferase RlmN [bacterium]|nr:23S rRNA (adenine(2503)-C(2))-methyltransferase RlmN [bacterium]